ncbi:helix-turn-helix transcriptional regulator, partial [Pseudomonas aeruginosa]|nr:helix-turn-helix transcriptional regulator [Pseudomonas aeruginosa]
LDRQPLGDGLFGLLGDARLGRALRAMLERPEHAWTLEQLAQQAAMSRASFVRAFSALGGTSPWNLLTRIRMEKARGLLRQTQKSLLDIAAETGYQSEAAFSRNFRQAFGESPGRFRRQADPAR